MVGKFCATGGGGLYNIAHGSSLTAGPSQGESSGGAAGQLPHKMTSFTLAELGMSPRFCFQMREFMRYKIARLMQFAGLIILPVAMAGNVTGDLSLTGFYYLAGIGVLVFFLGRLLQQNSKPE